MAGSSLHPPPGDLLDAFVELLAEVDSADPGSVLYSRICEVVCELAALERAGLFLFDPALRHVRVVGVAGVDRGVLGHLHGTLDEVPIARRALEQDTVQVSDDHANQLPPRYSGFLGTTTLTCTPLVAGGRWFGVIFADRGGGRFKLTDDERHAMWTLGKLAALAASARISADQRERERRLTERLELARDIHDRVVQRVFAVSLALGVEGGPGPAELARSREELSGALSDLRAMLERPLAAAVRGPSASLQDVLVGLGKAFPDLPIHVHGADVAGEAPLRVAGVAQSMLVEGARNASRHAQPTRIDVAVAHGDDILEVTMRNDGVREGSAGTGMGLRLLSLEAVQAGGVVDWGLDETGAWRLRLQIGVEPA